MNAQLLEIIRNQNDAIKAHSKSLILLSDARESISNRVSNLEMTVIDLRKENMQLTKLVDDLLVALQMKVEHP